MFEKDSIQIPVKELRKALTPLGKLIGSNMIVPILGFVVIKSSGGTVMISGSDLQTILSATVVINGIDGQTKTMLVNFKHLRKLVSLLSCEYIFVRESETAIVVNCEEGCFELEKDDIEAYPKAPSVKSDLQFLIETDQLKEGIALTGTSICTDDLRLAMTGVYFSTRDDFMTMTATDGQTLVEYTTSVRFEPPTWTSFILQRKCMQLIAGITDSPMVAMKIGVVNAEIIMGDYSIITRIIDDRFPNYRPVLPDLSATVIESSFVLAPFRKKVQLARLFSNITTHQVRFNFKRELIEISSKDFDYQIGSRQHIDIPKREGEEMQIGFNSKFLLDLLKPLSGNITLHLFAHNRAAIIIPQAKYSQQVTMLIMPVMLNEFV